MGKTILLTGGTGVLGKAILSQLKENNVICLVHRKTISTKNVTSIHGDICKPKFGLTDLRFYDLASRIDVIIHSAAITDNSQPQTKIEAVNVEGTQNVLSLAAASNAAFFHISTAFTHNDSNQEGKKDGLNTYERSKLASEQVVRNFGLPHIILRPSIIIGDSNTGVIPDYQAFHRLLSLYFMKLLPVLPGERLSYVDFIPSDVIAKIILALVQREVDNQEYWLTAGAKALKVKDIVTICSEYSMELIGRSIEPPKFVTTDMFDRLIRPVFLPALPSIQRLTIESALQLTSRLNMLDPFPSSLPDLLSEPNMPSFPDLQEALIHNLRCLVRTNRHLGNRGRFKRDKKAKHVRNSHTQKLEVGV